MKYTNRISEAQQKFIRKVRDGTMTLDELKAAEAANPKRYARWYRNKFFWANLHRAMQQVQRRSLLVVHLIAEEAKEHIHAGVRDKEGLEPNHLETCMKAREDRRAEVRLEQGRRRRPRGRGKKKLRVDPERDLVHPNFKHREAELLAVLEGKVADGC